MLDAINMTFDFGLPIINSHGYSANGAFESVNDRYPNKIFHLLIIKHNHIVVFQSAPATIKVPHNNCFGEIPIGRTHFKCRASPVVYDASEAAKVVGRKFQSNTLKSFTIQIAQSIVTAIAIPVIRNVGMGLISQQICSTPPIMHDLCSSIHIHPE